MPKTLAAPAGGGGREAPECTGVVGGDDRCVPRPDDRRAPTTAASQPFAAAGTSRCVTPRAARSARRSSTRAPSRSASLIGKRCTVRSARRLAPTKAIDASVGVRSASGLRSGGMTSSTGDWDAVSRELQLAVDTVLRLAQRSLQRLTHLLRFHRSATPPLDEHDRTIGAPSEMRAEVHRSTVSRPFASRGNRSDVVERDQPPAVVGVVGAAPFAGVGNVSPAPEGSTQN